MGRRYRNTIHGKQAHENSSEHLSEQLFIFGFLIRLYRGVYQLKPQNHYIFRTSFVDIRLS